VTALAGSEEFLYELSFGDNGGGYHAHSLTDSYGTVTTLSG